MDTRLPPAEVEGWDEDDDEDEEDSTDEAAGDQAEEPDAEARQLGLDGVLEPIRRLLGYRASYPEYETDSFWTQHVEPPPHFGVV